MRSCLCEVRGWAIAFLMSEWAIAFLMSEWAIVFLVSEWAIVFLWLVGRSRLREKLVNILTVQKSYKNHFIFQNLYPYPVIT